MKIYLYVVLSLAFAITGCSLYKTAVNVSRLKYKLDNVNNYTVSGVPMEGKRSIKDFTPFELIKITGNAAKKTFPVSFIVNVIAVNPYDSIAGYPRTDIIIKSFPWRLFIDDKETIDGDINSPVTVPGTGELVEIPIRVDVDLYKFFSDKDYKGLINLAFAIAGSKGYSSILKLYVHPTVSTAYGDITYPGELKIVTKEFTN